MWAHYVLMSRSKPLVCTFPVRSIILLPLFSLLALVGLGCAVWRHNGSLSEQRDHLQNWSSKTCWGTMSAQHRHYYHWAVVVLLHRAPNATCCACHMRLNVKLFWRWYKLLMRETEWGTFISHSVKYVWEGYVLPLCKKNFSEMSP